MRVAVTGGAGQLGTAVVTRLAADPAIEEIRVLDLQPHCVAGANVRFVKADITDPDFARHLDGCDALVHLAFIVVSNPGAEVFFRVNVAGSKNVFEAAVKAGIKNIVYSSSVAAYGVGADHPKPITEETPRQEIGKLPYSLAKFQVEKFLDGFEEEHPDLRIVRLRPGIIVGHYMDHDLNRMLHKGQVMDTGEITVALVWDEDVAQAVALALMSDARGAFNLAAAEPLTGAQMAAAGGLKLVKRPQIVMSAVAAWLSLMNRLGFATSIDPAWLKSQDADMVVSGEKARKELGWQPKMSTTADIAKAFAATAPGVMDKDIREVLRLMDGLAADQGDVRLHLCVTGKGGGDVGLCVEQGKVCVAEKLPRPPDGRVTMDAADFRALVAGKGNGETVATTGAADSGAVVSGIVKSFRDDVQAGKLGFMKRVRARKYLG